MRKTDTPVRHHSEEHFSRYEFKYVVPHDLRLEIENQVRHFMVLDPFVDSVPEQSYRVRSLYFDTPSSAAFYEKIDGIKDRKKYRIRTYGKKIDESPIFFEEKGRANQRTYKHRVKITKDLYTDLILGGNLFYLLERFPDVNFVNRFLTSKSKVDVSPRVVIDYERRPYVSNYDVYFRITFDSELKAIRSSEAFGIAEKSMRRCLAGRSIIEVKFNRKIPAWFQRIIQSTQLTRVSISKFVVGMCQCGLAVDLS